MSSDDTASTLPSTGPSTNGSKEDTPDSGQSQSSTFDTQPLSLQEDEDNSTNAWGQLTVIGGITHDLVESCYMVGRSNDCPIQLTETMEPIKKFDLWKACSKKHFKVYTETRATGTFYFIEDLSANGTILNNEIIGKGKFAVLNNGDVISLVKKDYKVFLFTECNVKEKNDGFSLEVRSQFMFIHDLGNGAFGTVKLAIRRKDKMRVACKCIAKTDKLVTTHSSQDLLKEGKIMRKLDHPCIIKVVSIMDTDSTLFIFMDLVEGGNLLQAVQLHRRLDADHAKAVFYQTCLAVQYLHKNNVVHRDLKPENILLSSKTRERQVVKVTDFGYSVIKATSSLLHTICGTSLYLAPELVNMACLGDALDRNNSEQGYTKAVDCWSLGVILYVCITGQPAFTPQREDMPLSAQITTGSYALKDQYWEFLEDGKDLVRKLLTVDPKKRITLDTALEHPYFRDTDMLNSVHEILTDEQGYPFEGITPIDGSDERPKKKARTEENTDTNVETCVTPLMSNDNNISMRDQTSSLSDNGTAKRDTRAVMDTTSVASENNAFSTSSTV